MFGLVPLVLVWVITILFARAWLYQLHDRSLATAGTVAAALLATVPTALCRITNDLVVATLVFGAFALAGLVFLWRRGPADPVPPTPRYTVPTGVRVLVAVGFVLVAWAAFGGHWWDEHNCHDGVVTVLARGIVPPVHPLFPTEPFRYHYGFDVLAAQLRAFTSMSADDAIDGATMICFVLLLGMARELGATLAGRAGAAAAMILVPFGGGLLSLFFWGQSGPLELRWDAIPARWLHLEIPPPVISNFFQHPQGLGMPLALAVLRLHTGEDHLRRRILGGLLLGALSLAQIVFFGVLGLVLGVLVVVRFAKTRNIRAAASSTATLLGALALAYLLGGMLERGPPVDNVMRFGTTFFTGSPGEVVMLHVVHFGAPLLATAAGIVVVAKRPTTLRIALLVAAVIGFAVPNFVTYERSWDIVKFYGIGAFFANLLLAAFVADLMRTNRRALAATIAVVTVFTGYLWILRMGALDGHFGIPKMRFPAPSVIGEVTAERLEPFLENDDFVFSSNTDVGLSGGLLTPGFDWRVNGQGYLLDRAVADRLHGHYRAARRTLGAEHLAAMKIRFVVLSPGDIGGLTDEARRALDDPNRFVHLFDVEAEGQRRRVFRVAP